MATRTLPNAASRVGDSADRRWLGLSVVAVAQLMIALDATVVNIALPSAQAGLGFADTDRQWIVSAYTLAFGGLLLVGGRLADSARVGRRGALMIGLVGFAAASALSGAAVNLGMLVAARALQGAFAAVLAPTALSTLAVMFTAPHERARAFGLYGAIAASGGAIGLLLGGILTQYLDWRWCLYINVPIAVLAALGAHAVLPDTRTPRVGGPAASLDLMGVVLSSGGLVAIVLGCAQAATLGWSAPVVLALVGAGALALALFVAHEAHSAAPLLPLEVVLDRQRGAAYMSALIAVAAMFGAFLFLTYLLQVVMRFSPLLAGAAFLPMTISSFVAGTMLAPRLLPRLSPRALMAPGFLLAAIGMGLLTRLHAGTQFMSGILPTEILLGVGVASVMMPASSVATSRLKPQVVGAAAATLNSAQQIGAALGVAVLNTIAAATTAALLSSTTRSEALIQGYASAAAWATVLLLIGAGIAFFLPVSPAGPVKTFHSADHEKNMK